MCSPVLLCKTLHIVAQEYAHGTAGHQRDAFRAGQIINYKLSLLFVFFLLLLLILIVLFFLLLFLMSFLLLLMWLLRLTGSKSGPWPVAADVHCRWVGPSSQATS